jgi:pre-mRNA-splicing factor 38B
VAGFLYIRFATNPKNFMKWFEEYLHDEEEFELEKGVKTTIGKLCCSLLKDGKYLTVLLPRIPVLIQREINGSLDKIFPPSDSTGSGDRKEVAEDRHKSKDNVRDAYDSRRGRNDTDSHRRKNDSREADKYRRDRCSRSRSPKRSSYSSRENPRRRSRSRSPRRTSDRRDGSRDDRRHREYRSRSKSPSHASRALERKSPSPAPEPIASKQPQPIEPIVEVKPVVISEEEKRRLELARKEYVQLTKENAHAEGKVRIGI